MSPPSGLPNLWSTVRYQAVASWPPGHENSCESPPHLRQHHPAGANGPICASVRAPVAHLRMHAGSSGLFAWVPAAHLRMCTGTSVMLRVCTACLSMHAVTLPLCMGRACTFLCSSLSFRASKPKRLGSSGLYD